MPQSSRTSSGWPPSPSSSLGRASSTSQWMHGAVAPHLRTEPRPPWQRFQATRDGRGRGNAPARTEPRPPCAVDMALAPSVGDCYDKRALRQLLREHRVRTARPPTGSTQAVARIGVFYFNRGGLVQSAPAAFPRSVSSRHRNYQKARGRGRCRCARSTTDARSAMCLPATV